MNASPSHRAQEKLKKHSPSIWLTHILLLHPLQFVDLKYSYEAIFCDDSC